ncbi:uncharacterized protein CBL_00387 [Carabus blaptoides fortunei]
MSMQIEADRRLLEFSTYEDYLDSLVSCSDVTLLRSLNDARKTAELGYRYSGDTLTRKEFYTRLATVKAYFYPKNLPTDLISKDIDVKENFLAELAKREKGNREGTLATIIFLRHFTKTGFEVSGYIDYADRLKKQDWLPIFKGKKRLWPRLDDLSYFHWRSKSTRKNNSINFKVIIDSVHGLLFQCWHDRKIVNVNPAIGFLGWQTTRTLIPTRKYEHIVLYDHVVRRRN